MSAIHVWSSGIGIGMTSLKLMFALGAFWTTIQWGSDSPLGKIRVTLSKQIRTAGGASGWQSPTPPAGLFDLKEGKLWRWSLNYPSSVVTGHLNLLGLICAHQISEDPGGFVNRLDRSQIVSRRKSINSVVKGPKLHSVYNKHRFTLFPRPESEDI